MFCGKYGVGDRVLVRIGARPLIAFKILECVNRDGPRYKFDWAEHGFDAMLNTVAIPEGSVVGPAK
jgi:hypothetical protein